MLNRTAATVKTTTTTTTTIASEATWPRAFLSLLYFTFGIYFHFLFYFCVNLFVFLFDLGFCLSLSLNLSLQLPYRRNHLIRLTIAWSHTSCYLFWRNIGAWEVLLKNISQLGLSICLMLCISQQTRKLKPE